MSQALTSVAGYSCIVFSRRKSCSQWLDSKPCVLLETQYWFYVRIPCDCTQHSVLSMRQDDDESSSSSRSSSMDRSPSPERLLLSPDCISNPEMRLFMRRSSLQMTRRRSSLADIIPDWPSLDVIQKPQFKVKEVMWLTSWLTSHVTLWYRF